MNIPKSKLTFNPSAIALTIATIIWASTYFVIKDSLDLIGPNILNAYRFSLATILIAIYLVHKRTNLFQDYKKGLVLGAILFTLYCAQNIGLQYTTATNAGFISGLFILFTPIFSYVLQKTKITKQVLASTALALIGLWLITGGASVINIGDVLTLCAAASFALYLVVSDIYIDKDADAKVLLFQQFFVIAILSFVTGGLLNESFKVEFSDVVVPIVYLAIFPSIVSFELQLLSQRKLSALQSSVISASQPLFAALFAWTLGHEAFTLVDVAAGILIALSVMSLLLSKIKFKT